MRRYTLRVPAAEADAALLRMLEWFPQGIEEEADGDHVVLAGYAEQPPAPGLTEEAVEEGWQDRWRELHRPVRWAGCGWGRPGRRPSGSRSSSTRGGRSARGRTARPGRRWSCSSAGAGPALDIGCGSGVLSIAALGWASGRCTRSTSIRWPCRPRTKRGAERSGAEVAGRTRSPTRFQPRRCGWPTSSCTCCSRCLSAADGHRWCSSRACSSSRPWAALGRAVVDGWAAELVAPVTRHSYRFFARGVAAGFARLSPADHHHLSHVLRMRVGDTCEVVSGAACSGPGSRRGMRADRGGHRRVQCAGGHGLDRPAGRPLGRGGREADGAGGGASARFAASG